MLIATGYDPRPQFAALHRRTQRWAVAVCHRRAGKTVACVNDLIDAALTCPRPEARYAYVAPTYTQAKDVAWLYLLRYTAMIPGARPHESELRVDLPGGGRVRLYGADNYDRLRGLYLDGVVLDEYGDMDPRAWSEVIRPALADRSGNAIFIGTPKGRNHFAELWDRAARDDGWHRMILRASESGILPESELADARKTMTPEQYAQEFECSFQAAVVGAIYGREMEAAEREGRIASVPHDPAHQVQTWWDLGMRDSTAIWCVQYVGREVRIIDYIEGSGEALPFYARELAARPYLYSDHVLPHDAEARELGTGRTRVETLESLGLRNITVTPQQDVEDGISAARLLLPRCWIDATRCARGIDALREYRRDWDERNKVFRSRPLHNWASHGADAFRCGAMGGTPPTMRREAREHHGGPGSWMA